MGYASGRVRELTQRLFCCASWLVLPLSATFAARPSQAQPAPAVPPASSAEPVQEPMQSDDAPVAPAAHPGPAAPPPPAPLGGALPAPPPAPPGVALPSPPAPPAARPALLPRLGPVRSTLQPLPEPARRREWYGWQTLTVDGSSIALLFFAGASQNETLAWTALGGYAFGAPIVHAAHGNALGLLSLSVRVTFPVVGALIGGNAENCGSHVDHDFCGLGGAVSGFLIGGVAAIVLDASALAWEPRKRREQARRTLTLAPMAGAGRQGLSVLGTF